jgi:ATP synthase protein I
VVPQRGSQTLLSVGLEWSSRITAIGLEFSLPALLGFGVDHWLRTSPAVTVTGAFLGFGLGMVHTLRMARELSGDASSQSRASHNPPEPPRLRGHDDRADLS